MPVSHDGVWTGGANDCDWRRIGVKSGVPGRQAGEVCQLTSRGVLLKMACSDTGGLKRGQGSEPDGRSEDRRQEARRRLLAE